MTRYCPECGSDDMELTGEDRQPECHACGWSAAEPVPPGQAARRKVKPQVTILRRPVIKRCPYKNETDAGDLIITIPGPAPELHELGDCVDALAAQAISHEDFTSGVTALLPDGSQVTTHWNTGPWSVEVREGSDLLRDSIDQAGA